MSDHRCTTCGGDLDTGMLCHNSACRPPVTAPAARTLAEIVKEARRLEESAAFVGRESVPWEEFSDACARVDAFYAEHGTALLAVAEAAVEWEAAAEKFCAPKANPLRSLLRKRMFAAEAALRAAVRGEEKTK